MKHLTKAHRTEGGWCCACGYDMAVLEEKIDDERQRIKGIIRKMKKVLVADWRRYNKYPENMKPEDFIENRQNAGYNKALDDLLKKL